MITRRQLAIGAGAGLLCGFLGRPAGPASAKAWAGDVRHEAVRIERALEARLGLAILHTATGERIGHRAEERFPMCSTFKVLAAGAVLRRVDAGQEDLGRRIDFGAADLVAHSPVTGGRVGRGMTLAELCEAAVTRSDNTAANLILATLGGPAGLTGFARALGDAVTRLDRTETGLNEARPGDPRDTTTPAAMADTLHAIVLGTALSAPSRDRLAAWMVANTTGDAKLRAGLPKGWRVGDKTGSGGRGTMNDVAVVWPPGRPPLVVSLYIT